MIPGWQRVAFWTSLFALSAYLLYLISGILLPFVAGFAIAYFLDPVADRLEQLRLPRWAAAIIVLVAFFLLVIACFVLVVPLLQGQLSDLIRRFPDFMKKGQGQAEALIYMLQEHLAPEDIQRLKEAVGAKAGDLVSWIISLLTGLVTGGLAIANLLSLIFIMPVVAFFLLRDWDHIVALVDSWLPRHHLHTLREQAALVDQTLSGFIRGQASVCLILGVFYACALTLAGLDFGLTIGLLIGLLIFIPYVGTAVGAVLSIGLASLQFDDWHRVMVVAGIFLVGQTLEGNFLTPKLVGDRVNLHPVWVIFALLAFGTLFGFVGVLVAVPVAAVIGVGVRFALKQYLMSSLYDPRRASR
jgi:predicted PurR-regulated permease PerM